MTSWPFVSRTFATLRSAELGFFGVRVITCVQTPRRCGQFASAGDLDFTLTFWRPLRTSWLMVGIERRVGGSAIWKCPIQRAEWGLKTRRGKHFAAHRERGGRTLGSETRRASLIS